MNQYFHWTHNIFISQDWWHQNCKHGQIWIVGRLWVSGFHCKCLAIMIIIVVTRCICHVFSDILMTQGKDKIHVSWVGQSIASEVIIITFFMSDTNQNVESRTFQKKVPVTQVRKEFYLYPFISLVSDFGGSLGLFVGFSFYALWDLIPPLLHLGSSSSK